MTGAECSNRENRARIESISAALPSEHPRRGQREAGGTAQGDSLPVVFEKLCYMCAVGVTFACWL